MTTAERYISHMEDLIRRKSEELIKLQGEIDGFTWSLTTFRSMQPPPTLKKEN